MMGKEPSSAVKVDWMWKWEMAVAFRLVLSCHGFQTGAEDRAGHARPLVFKFRRPGWEPTAGRTDETARAEKAEKEERKASE